ncbi:MAG: PQQ-binding-like beta-propeller repeat protein [Theionarchaea archaeon]|nr:PQQ-binding-like beta-propeller repeat protein [Theionarchaea archaeon]
MNTIQDGTGDTTKRIMCVIAVVLLLLPIEGEGWPLLYHDSQRQSFSESSAPDSLYIQSVIELPEPIIGSCAAESGKIYICGESSLFCIDFEGNILWKTDPPGHVLHLNIPPSLIQGKVALGGLWSMNFFDMDTGALIESIETLTVVASSPATVDEYIVFGKGEGRYIRRSGYPDELLIVDSTLQVQRKFKAKGNVDCSPATYMDVLVLATVEGYIYCINTSGNIVWDSYSEGGVLTSPTIWWGRAFILSDNLLCFDLFTGDLLWEQDIPGIQNTFYPNSHLSAGYGRGYINTVDGIVCVDFLSGSILWKRDYEEPSDISVADEKIFFASGTEIISCNAFSGELLWSFRTENELFPPIISDGNIIVPSKSKLLYIFGINPEEYLEKAEKYMEKKEYEKAYFSYKKAEEYTGEQLKEVDIAEEKMKDKNERVSEAFQKIEKADRYIRNGDFGFALALYRDAYEVFESQEMDLMKNLCEERINYINEKKTNSKFVFILVLVMGILVCGLVVRKKLNTHRR